MIQCLYEPIGDFLKLIYNQTNDGKSSKRPKPMDAITITLDSTLEEAMDLLIRHRIHRVFVVNDRNKLLGVVSISDVIQQFA
jgi:CBS domain-containing protein